MRSYGFDMAEHTAKNYNQQGSLKKLNKIQVKINHRATKGRVPLIQFKWSVHVKCWNANIKCFFVIDILQQVSSPHLSDLRTEVTSADVLVR